MDSTTLYNTKQVKPDEAVWSDLAKNRMITLLCALQRTIRLLCGFSTRILYFKNAPRDVPWPHWRLPGWRWVLRRESSWERVGLGGGKHVGTLLGAPPAHPTTVGCNRLIKSEFNYYSDFKLSVPWWQHQCQSSDKRTTQGGDKALANRRAVNLQVTRGTELGITWGQTLSPSPVSLKSLLGELRKARTIPPNNFWISRRCHLSEFQDVHSVQVTPVPGNTPVAGHRIRLNLNSSILPNSRQASPPGWDNSITTLLRLYLLTVCAYKDAVIFSRCPA